MANVLKKHGVKAGDRVMIYLPMIPEAVIAMLACARIGAPAQRGLQRLQRRGAQGTHQRLRREGDHHGRRRLPARLGARRSRRNVDEALLGAPKVKSVIVVQRTKQEVDDDAGPRFLAARGSADGQRRLQGRAVSTASIPLFILYTSGSTGKPKGILHTTAGYLLGCHMTTKYYFDLRPEDVYFCTADVGWITGHSYVAYGVLSNGGTSLIYEGAPNFPEPDRFWRIIDKHKVNIFYTAPTAIRSFIKWGDDWLTPHDLSSLRLLGSVGEPINPEAWMWYHDKVGGKRCPIVDTWWQTETGCHMIAPDARRHAAQARLGHAAVLRRRCRRGR